MPNYSRLANLPSWSNAGAGLSAVAYVAPVEWFTAISSVQAPFTNLGDGVQIRNAHTFIAGKGFLRIACAPKSNSLDANVTGDPGFVKQDQKATLFFPGNTPELHETYQTLLNVPLIVLVKDSDCAANLYMQLGCDCEGAFLGGPFNTGVSGSGKKGFNAEVTYDGPVVFYNVTGGPELLP